MRKLWRRLRSGGRDNVSCVILGRGESSAGVEKWINAGKSVPGIVGFAIGRTIFADALTELREGKINRDRSHCKNLRKLYAFL